MLEPSTPELTFLYCPTCARDSFAEAPPCPDGHEDQCPDRACVECGTALLLDALLFDLTLVRTRARNASRRAA